jgi:hypothetical protein
MPVFPGDAAVNRVVRFHRPNLAFPDVDFQNAHVEAVFAAGRITDAITGLRLFSEGGRIRHGLTSLSHIIAQIQPGHGFDVSPGNVFNTIIWLQLTTIITIFQSGKHCSLSAAEFL